MSYDDTADFEADMHLQHQLDELDKDAPPPMKECPVCGLAYDGDYIGSHMGEEGPCPYMGDEKERVEITVTNEVVEFDPTIFERIKYWWSNWSWLWERRIRGIKCFFVGHNIKWGERIEGHQLEPDWCGRCMLEEPDEKLTASIILGRLYVRWCNLHLPGWERFDLWLADHYGKHLPSWWEY